MKSLASRSFVVVLALVAGLGSPLWAAFATLDGGDAAYILGGVLGNTYRGLQFSFDDRYRAHSLGNLCQLQEIGRLCEQGVDVYDLGTEVPYKKRWGDRVFATTCLVVQPS